MKQLFISLSLAFASFVANAIGLQESIFKFANDDVLHSASVGISVVRIADGEEIAGYDSSRANIPASTMKSLTSATALALLGDDFTFDTEVKLVGNLKNHDFEGTILVMGSGDPTLGSKYIQDQPDFISEIISALKAEGIEKIKGRIAFFPDERNILSVNPVWMSEDLPTYYGAGAYPFNYADNSFRIDFTLNNAEISNVKTKPEDVDVEIVNHCVVVDASKPYSESYPELLRFPEDNKLHFYGYIESGIRKAGYTCSLPSPQCLFSKRLVQALDSADIKFSYNEDVASKHISDTTDLLTHSSPELPVIVKSLLERSDNMFTESVLKAIGQQASGELSTAQGIREVYRFWKGMGLDTSHLFMKDGSGLARNNKVSALFLSKMLAKAQTEAVGEDLSFASLFPRLGKDGTVRNLIKKSPYAGKIALKSGSMGDVQCFAGYYPVNNPKYAVTFLVNNYSCSRRELIKKLETLILNILPNLQ